MECDGEMLLMKRVLDGVSAMMLVVLVGIVERRKVEVDSRLGRAKSVRKLARHEEGANAFQAAIASRAILSRAILSNICATPH